LGALQPLHLALIALLVVLLFGPKKLPELARGLGDAMKELKKSLRAEGEPEQEP
jgi:sec-independent protein translocase protein TatA